MQEEFDDHIMDEKYGSDSCRYEDRHVNKAAQNKSYLVPNMGKNNGQGSIGTTVPGTLKMHKKSKSKTTTLTFKAPQLLKIDPQILQLHKLEAKHLRANDSSD